MVDFVKKVQKKAGHDLLTGEVILDARVIQPAGSAFRNAVAAGAMSHTGALMDHRIQRWRTSQQNRSQAAVEASGGLAVDFPTSKCFLTLTDKRVLVHSFASMTGSPKDLLASYELKDLAGMGGEQGKLVSKLNLFFADGSSVPLDVMKGGGDPQKLVDAFNQALTKWDN